MEAIIFFTSVTFMVAIGSAVVQGRDLENQDSGIHHHHLVTEPSPSLQMRQENRGARRWPGAAYTFDQTNPRWSGVGQSMGTDRRHMSNPYIPGPVMPMPMPILEDILERSPTPATINHLTPAAKSRDEQGYMEPKP
ncbi:hypothetical protein N7478_008584 [Penicillium angulare]|uniref:uncharacterized protein n=1 Tax=Penicillium angulare TaxID=116970 RepID=UPI002541AF2E|nr:uncharacterized protein N7478_008584 [Penicillium angulare]KAJ5273459.1 hypothetical protein N7478_008584 [Penicillium angulare]